MNAFETSASDQTFVAFFGDRRLAFGPLHEVLTQAKPQIDAGHSVLFFEERTGKQVDFDLRGTLAEVLARHAPPPPRARPGRPKLGVVSREVSLMPSQWEWLAAQSMGVSGALRRLVEQARKSGQTEERERLAREAVANLLWSVAGNLPNFEDVTRALFARDDAKLHAYIQEWPADLRLQIARMLEAYPNA